MNNFIRGCIIGRLGGNKIETNVAEEFSIRTLGFHASGEHLK